MGFITMDNKASYFLEFYMALPPWICMIQRLPNLCLIAAGRLAETGQNEPNKQTMGGNFASCIGIIPFKKKKSGAMTFLFGWPRARFLEFCQHVR